MSTRALALAAALAAAGSAHAQDLALELKGGGVGQTLNVVLDGGPGEGYLLLMSTQWGSTPLPAPHVSPLDIGFELVGPSRIIGENQQGSAFPRCQFGRSEGCTGTDQAAETGWSIGHRNGQRGGDDQVFGYHNSAIGWATNDYPMRRSP